MQKKEVKIPVIDAVIEILITEILIENKSLRKKIKGAKDEDKNTIEKGIKKTE